MKSHWAKNSFGELDINWLQEDFWDDETLALSYLESKFDIDVVNDIKERVRVQLMTDWEDVFYTWWSFN